MVGQLKILVLEDREADARLAVRELTKAGLKFDWQLAADERQFREALAPDLDLVLADYSLPSFNAPAALSILRATGYDIPFIVVTGAIGEEEAVACIKQGATDYLLKDRMSRLGEAVRRALEERQQREDQRKAESDLRHSEELMRAIINVSPVAIACVDGNKRVLTWNRAAEAIFGYRAEEVVGRPYTMVGDDGQAQFDDIWALHQAGEQFSKQAVKRKRKDGSFAHVNISTAALFEGTGKIRLVVVCFEDISRQVTIEEQLRQAQKMEAVGQLTGGLAHDFNNLLGIIVGNLDMLLMDLENQPDLHELADAAFRAALRGGELTRQLLAFSRRQPLQPSVTDANELVASTVKLLRRLLGEDIRIQVKAGDIWPVVVDQAQLGAILANIATNARDAMPNGGDLIIQTSNTALDADYASHYPEVVPGEYVCISLTDSGCGMPPEVLAHAFEPFFTTKPVGKGTGLGLSMAYGFAKQSGGHLNLYSEVGHGTTVRLYLPRSRDGAASRSEQAAGSVVARARPGEVVLVVEDNADLRSTVVRQLSELGYATIEAEDVLSTHAVLSNCGRVDLLFTDIVMPGGMSGMDLAELVRSERPDIRILFTSGFPDYAAKGGWNAESGNMLLSKPYRRDDLARAVRKALDA